MSLHINNKAIFTLCCKWATYLTLLFTTLLGIDLLLPRQIKHETILSRERELILTGGQYQIKRYVPSRESSLVVTQHYKFPVKVWHMEAYRPGDSIALEVTRLIGLVTRAQVKDEQGNALNIGPKLSILDVFWFVPVITFITALLGTILSMKNIRVIDFGIVNLIMMWILLQLLRILPF